jgi:hypothetical protein
VVAGATTGLVIIIALIGTRATLPGVDGWPRFWGIVFFALLFWPVGITLCGRLAGRFAQLACSALVLALTVGQQLGAGTLPIPLVQSWYATIAGPGDAIRRDIALPDATDGSWQRAWERAASVAVAICTEKAVPAAAEISVQLNGARATPLSALRRSGRDEGTGWYFLPITREEADTRRPLSVEVRRDGQAGVAVRVCGGQDDPTRAGWEGSMRRRGGVWSTEGLSDIDVPAIFGRPAPSRYYVELRFFTADGLPHAGIWY